MKWENQFERRSGGGGAGGSIWEEEPATPVPNSSLNSGEEAVNQTNAAEL